MNIAPEQIADPLTTLAEGYKQAGNELLSQTLVLFSVGTSQQMEKIYDIGRLLTNMDVPFSDSICFNAFALDSPRRQSSLWRSLMRVYAASGFEVSDEVFNAASKRVNASLPYARTAFAPGYIQTKSTLIKPTLYKDDDDVMGEHRLATPGETLRLKINAYETRKRHGGNQIWNNLLIGMHRQRLAKLAS